MVIQHTINYYFNKFTCPQAGFEPMTLLPLFFEGEEMSFELELIVFPSSHPSEMAL